MANRRNTQRTPPRQKTPTQLLEQRVDTWIAAAGPLIDRLDRQLQIFERAFISLAQDVEYISAVLDREGMLLEDTDGPEPEGGKDYSEPRIVDEEAFEQEFAGPDEPEESPEEESPEEEAARLIAEAERLNETGPEDYQ